MESDEETRNDGNVQTQMWYTYRPMFAPGSQRDIAHCRDKKGDIQLNRHSRIILMNATRKSEITCKAKLRVLFQPLSPRHLAAVNLRVLEVRDAAVPQVAAVQSDAALPVRVEHAHSVSPQNRKLDIWIFEG